MRRVNLATLLFFTANGIAIIAIPPYLRDIGITSELVIGQIVSTAFFVSIVLRPLSGLIGDRLGYMRVMRIGVLSAVAAQVMYLAGSPFWISVGRVFHGIAIATFLPMSIATSVAEGARAMAARSLAVGVGNILGPLVGSVIYDLGGAKAAFITTSILHGVNLFIAGRLPEGGARDGERGRPEGRVFLFMALLSIFSMTYMSISTFTPVRLRDLGMPIANWGAFASSAAVASLIPRLFIMRSGLISPAGAAVATLIALAGLVAVTLAGDLPYFIAAGVIYGLGQGAMVVTYQILALSGTRRAGLASAVYTMGWDIGSIVGPTVAGFLIERAGFTALHYMPLAMLINVAVLLALYRGKPS